MEELVYLGIILFLLWLSFQFGYKSGYEENIHEEMANFVLHLPVNVEYYEKAGIHYAHLMGLNSFLGQWPSYETMLENLQNLFPERAVVLTLLDDDEAV